MTTLPVVIPKDFDKYFFNRKKDMEQINANLSLLEKDVANQILITGYRGVGKTFLLKKLLKEQPDKYLTCYIDLSKTYGGQQGKLTEEEVMKEFLNKINESISKQDNNYSKVERRISNFLKQLKLKEYDFSNINILDIQLPDIKNNYLKFSKFVMELPQVIVDTSDDIKGFIIVVDEFQLLRSLKKPEAFFWLIRSYTQEQYNVSYIFTGSVSQTSEIINMINGQNGAFGGRMLQFNVDPFSKEHTKEYLNKYISNLSFTEEGFERFYSCTRGIPAYINSLASILPNNMLCDENIVLDVLQLNIDQVAIMWVYIWGRLTSGEKDFIIYLLENDGATRSDLTENFNYSKSSVTRFIDSLSNQGIIEFEYGKNFVLADKMLKLWLKIKFNTKGTYPL